MSGERELQKLKKDLARSREEIANLQRKLRDYILKKSPSETSTSSKSSSRKAK
jgi:hypothetical protein